MAFISALALIMLTMVGYSAGSAWVGNGKHRVPGIFDLVVVVLLWILLFAVRGDLGRWTAVLAGVIGAGIVGAIITIAIKANLTDMDEAPMPNIAGMNPVRQLWERWKHFSQKIGDFQGRLLMGYFYFFIVTPFGIIMQLFSDPLNKKQAAPKSNWTIFQNTSSTIEKGRQQF